MISAFSSSQRLVLGQRKVADKSNEITAIPELLDLLAVKGAIVTIDAMGCQKGIAKKIIDKAADYVLALKGNQGTLSDDVELFFTEQKARDFKDTVVSRHETLEKSRPCAAWLCHDAASRPERPRPSTISIGSRRGMTGLA